MTPWTMGDGARTLVPVEGMRVLPNDAKPHTRDWFGRIVANRSRPTRTYRSHLFVCRPGIALEPYTDQPIDLGDRVTFLLALDALAGRVGLDAAAGVGWWRDPKRGDWWLVLPGGARDQLFPGIDTADPIEALDRALFATASAPAPR